MTNHEDEPGLIDLMEKFEAKFETLKEVVERISAATVEIGRKMEAGTAEQKGIRFGPRLR